MQWTLYGMITKVCYGDKIAAVSRKLIACSCEMHVVLCKIKKRPLLTSKTIIWLNLRQKHCEEENPCSTYDVKSMYTNHAKRDNLTESIK